MKNNKWLEHIVSVISFALTVALVSGVSVLAGSAVLKGLPDSLKPTIHLTEKNCGH